MLPYAEETYEAILFRCAIGARHGGSEHTVKRVLLVQPSLQPPGGGNGVAAWVLQSLVGVHRGLDSVLDL